MSFIDIPAMSAELTDEELSGVVGGLFLGGYGYPFGGFGGYGYPGFGIGGYGYPGFGIGGYGYPFGGFW